MRARHHPHLSQQDNNHIHRWTVSYADYMTLMFALFVVLYAVSLNKEEKYQEIIETIQNASQFMYSDKEAHDSDVHDSDAPGILIKRSNDIKENTGPALLSDGDNDQLGFIKQLPSEELSNVKQYYMGEPLAVLQLSLQSALQSELGDEALSIDLNGDWLTINMSGPLLFAGSSHTLLNNAKQKIQQIVAVLKPVNNMIRLRGYTDINSISDEIYKSNWELSVMRAISVLHAFDALGIAGERMVVEGFGKFQPVLDGNGLVDIMKSRRVVIAISKFALMTKKPLSSDVDQPLGQEQKEIQGTSKSGSNNMREVYLPDGRLIITTRQE